MKPIPASAHAAAASGPLFVVLNAGSGKHNADEEQAVMARIFEDAGRPSQFFQVTDASQINRFARKAVALASERGGVVVAAGGDGTINAVASATLGSGCPFGVLPQGTFNYFGRANAIPQETADAARALMGASISPVQVGQVNGRVFLVNASLGLYPEVLADREAWKKRLGRSRLVALIAALATVFRAPPSLQLQIELEGRPIAKKTRTLFIGNNHLQLAQVGMGDKLVGAVEDDGHLAGIAVRHVGSWALLGMVLRGFLGRMGDDDNIESFAFRRLTVANKLNKSMKIALDGEVMRMRAPLVFEVSPTPLLLLMPAPADRAEVA